MFLSDCFLAEGADNSKEEVEIDEDVFGAQLYMFEPEPGQEQIILLYSHTFAVRVRLQKMPVCALHISN